MKLKIRNLFKKSFSKGKRIWVITAGTICIVVISVICASFYIPNHTNEQTGINPEDVSCSETAEEVLPIEESDPESINETLNPETDVESETAVSSEEKNVTTSNQKVTQPPEDKNIESVTYNEDGSRTEKLCFSDGSYTIRTIYPNGTMMWTTHTPGNDYEPGPIEGTTQGRASNGYICPDYTAHDGYSITCRSDEDHAKLVADYEEQKAYDEKYYGVPFVSYCEDCGILLLKYQYGTGVVYYKADNYYMCGDYSLCVDCYAKREGK